MLSILQLKLLSPMIIVTCTRYLVSQPIEIWILTTTHVINSRHKRFNRRRQQRKSTEAFRLLKDYLETHIIRARPQEETRLPSCLNLLRILSHQLLNCMTVKEGNLATLLSRDVDQSQTFQNSLMPTIRAQDVYLSTFRTESTLSCLIMQDLVLLISEVSMAIV